MIHLMILMVSLPRELTKLGQAALYFWDEFWRSIVRWERFFQDEINTIQMDINIKVDHGITMGFRSSWDNHGITMG